MEVCGGCVAACFVNPSVSAKLCTKRVTATAFGWNGDGFTEQCPWLKGFCFVRPRLVELGVVFVARTRESKHAFHITIVGGWKTTLMPGERSGGALDVAPRRSTDNPRTLFQCKKWCGPMRLLARKEVSPEGGAKVQEKQLGRKRRSANGALTRAGVASYFLEQAT